ncbi:MAG: hypothetical protein GVY13_14550 [Alphaproteobacteria bacterium]|nr:hypothetical protein [Alphaproteobacteria bacterium]
MTDRISVPPLVRGLCLLGAAVCAAIALSAFVGWAGTAANLGLAFATPAGEVEFLTFYGGFYAGLTLFFLLALRSRALATGAMAFLALGNAGAFVGRVAAMAALGTASPLLIGLAVGEIVLAALGGWGWRRMAIA